MMRRLMWFLVGVLLVGVPMVSFAQSFAQVTQVKSVSPGDAATGTPGEALKNANQHFLGTWVGTAQGSALSRVIVPESIVIGGITRYCGPAMWGGVNAHRYRSRCETAAGSGAYIYLELVTVPGTPPDCPEGQTRDANTGLCIEPPCTEGTVVTSSVHVGWSNVWDVNARPYGVSSPTSGCAGQCKVSGYQLADESCYLGDSGSGAPYQVLCWYRGQQTGQQCAEGEDQITDRRPPIPCPAGTASGTINGKSACLPATTTETETTTKPDGGTTETTTKTNPDGSTETTTTEKDAAGNTTSSRTIKTPAPGEPGGAGSTGEPGPGGEPQGEQDPLKDCVANPEACEGAGNGFGGPEPTADFLFTPDNEKTYAGVIQKFRDDMAGTDFVQAVNGYFSVTASGTCPIWTKTIPFIDVTLTIDQFCTPEVAGMLQVMKGVLLVIFGFVAFRYAVL